MPSDVPRLRPMLSLTVGWHVSTVRVDYLEPRRRKVYGSPFQHVGDGVRRNRLMG